MKFRNVLKRMLRRSTLLNIFPRIFYAMRYFNHKYPEIVKWGFLSREDTNYTYNLTNDNLLYLANMVAIVCKISFQDIKSYINEAQNDKELMNLVVEKTIQSKFLTVADLRCDFGRRLGWYAFVRALKPNVVIETGVDKGLGSVILCSALLRNKEEGYKGKYYGTDINPEAGYLLDGKYKEIGELLYGDSIKSLEEFNCEIDLFINDSDHSAEYEYREYLAIKNKLSSKAVILGDNSHKTNKLALFSIENNRNFLFFHEVPLNHWYPVSAWREIGAKAKVNNIEFLLNNRNHDYGKVLEIGCGEGSILKLLSEKYSNWKLYGCDISVNALTIARKREIGNLKELFICHFNFPEDEFDLIIMTHVLEHVPDPQRMLRKIRRIGKHFMFEVPLEDNIIAANLRKKPGNYAEQIGHINFFSRNSFRYILEQSGFVILKEKTVTPPYYVSSFYSSGFMEKVKEMFKYMAKRMLLMYGFETRFTYNYALLCKKNENINPREHNFPL